MKRFLKIAIEYKRKNKVLALNAYRQMKDDNELLKVLNGKLAMFNNAKKNVGDFSLIKAINSAAEKSSRGIVAKDLDEELVRFEDAVEKVKESEEGFKNFASENERDAEEELEKLEEINVKNMLNSVFLIVVIFLSCSQIHSN